MVINQSRKLEALLCAESEVKGVILGATSQDHVFDTQVSFYIEVSVQFKLLVQLYRLRLWAREHQQGAVGAGCKNEFSIFEGVHLRDRAIIESQL